MLPDRAEVAEVMTIRAGGIFENYEAPRIEHRRRAVLLMPCGHLQDAELIMFSDRATDDVVTGYLKEWARDIEAGQCGLARRECLRCQEARR